MRAQMPQAYAHSCTFMFMFSNPNPIFNPNLNPFLKENKNDTGI